MQRTNEQAQANESSDKLAKDSLTQGVESMLKETYDQFKMLLVLGALTVFSSIGLLIGYLVQS